MPDFDQFGIPKKTAQPSAKVDAYGIPIKEPVQQPVDMERIRRVPSFKEFAASKGLPVSTQRQMAEGTYGPDLAMKAKMDREVEEAPERKRTRAIQEGQRKNEALINTTKKRLNGKGVKYEDFDPIFKKELENTKADVESGVLVLSEDASRNPVYKQALYGIETLGYAMKNSIDESVLAARFDRADNRERQKIADEYSKREQEFVPTGFVGKVSEILGGAAPLIAEARTGAAIGTAVGPEGTLAGIIGSVLMTLPDAFSKGRLTETIKRYNQDIQEIQKKKGAVTQADKDASMQRASSVGIVGGLTEAGVVSGLSLISGSPAAGKGLLNAVKNWGKHAAYDVTRQASLGVTSEVAKGITAKAAGYNVTAGDIIEDAVRRGGADAEMALAFSAYHATLGVPKYVKSAAKNYLSTLPRPELNNLATALEGQGVIQKSSTSRMNADLDAFEQAKQEFKGLVPDEDMGTFAGLALRKKNLEEKIKSTTLAPVRAKLQEESDAIDTRMEAMLKSKNPIVDEVNDLTGDTGEAEILTEDRIQESVANLERTVVEPPVSDIEANKVEIERRRQEELESRKNKIEVSRTEYTDSEGNVHSVREFEDGHAEHWLTPVGTTVPQNISSNSSNIYTKEYLEDISDGPIGEGKSVEPKRNLVNKINAKYDAELAALQGAKPASKQAVEFPKTEGTGGMVKFAEGVEIPFKYKIIDAENLKPSHLPSGERNPEHSIALAQPKERGDIQSKLAQERISKAPNLGEVGESPNPYFGAPVVNARGEVIQGNNRSLGLKKHYEEGGASYKEQLANNAEKFGLTREQVEGMKNPVLVRESAIDDAMAVELGNYDVKDLETGGKQRIDPITTVRKMSPEDKNKLAAIIFDGDYSTVKEAIRDNQQQVGSIVSKQINAAQRNTIFDKEGNINPKGIEDIENIVNNMLFESGPAVLPEAFTELSFVQQKNIQKAIKHIFSTPEGTSILPEVQNAILGLYDYRKSGIDNFNAWLSTVDIFEGKTPKDIFTPVEIKMMETLSKAKTQSELSKQLSEYADLVKGKPADMFEPERAGISKEEAIKKTFNVEYEDVTKRYPKPEGEAAAEKPLLAEEPKPEFKRATEQERADFDEFSRAERERPDFDAEYRRERVDGETVEQYLLKKYCR